MQRDDLPCEFVNRNKQQTPSPPHSANAAAMVFRTLGFQGVWVCAFQKFTVLRSRERLRESRRHSWSREDFVNNREEAVPGSWVEKNLTIERGRWGYENFEAVRDGFESGSIN
jgi:hypothetical protein